MFAIVAVGAIAITLEFRIPWVFNFSLILDQSREQFESFRKEFSDVFPTNTQNKGSILNTGNAINQAAMYGDANLLIMSSKNNPLIEVRFSDLFPVALGGLQFDQQLTDTTYLTATATFSYKMYEMFVVE